MVTVVQVASISDGPGTVDELECEDTDTWAICVPGLATSGASSEELPAELLRAVAAATPPPAGVATRPQQVQQVGTTAEAVCRQRSSSPVWLPVQRQVSVPWLPGHPIPVATTLAPVRQVSRQPSLTLPAVPPHLAPPVRQQEQAQPRDLRLPPDAGQPVAMLAATPIFEALALPRRGRSLGAKEEDITEPRLQQAPMARQAAQAVASGRGRKGTSLEEQRTGKLSPRKRPSVPLQSVREEREMEDHSAAGPRAYSRRKLEAHGAKVQ